MEISHLSKPRVPMSFLSANTTNFVAQTSTDVSSYSSGGGKSEIGLTGPEIKVNTAVFLFGNSSLALPVSGLPPILGLQFPSILRASSHQLNLSLLTSLTETNPSFHIESPCDYIVHTQIIQDNFPLLRSDNQQPISHLPSEILLTMRQTYIYTHILKIEPWTSFGSHYSAYQSHKLQVIMDIQSLEELFSGMPFFNERTRMTSSFSQ